MTTPVLVGSKLHLNTTTANMQGQVSVTALQDGTFVAVWQHDNWLPGGSEIRGQIFNADGSMKGSEFIVNSTASTANTPKTVPVVAALADGRFVVAWEDNPDDDAKGSEITARVFGPDGPIGGDFTANASPDGWQFGPSITALSNGGFVISYTSYSVDGTQTDIKAQAYDAALNPVGPEVLANTTTANDQRGSAVAAWGSGYVVFYSDYSNSPDDPVDFTLRARILNADGTEVKSEFLVSDDPGRKGDASATALKDGRYVVTWTTDAGDGTELCTKAQIFEANGNRVGSEFIVNALTDRNEMYSVVAALPDGGFAIAYCRITEAAGDDPGRSEIYLATFNADGTRRSTGDLLVGVVNMANHEKIDIAVLSNGHVVVSWEDPTAANDPLGGVYAQIVDTGYVAIFVGDDTDQENVGTGAVDDMDGKGGHDKLLGHGGNDILKGGEGNDTLEGGSEDDDLDGGEGNDILDGGSGDDQLAGGNGNDTYHVHDAGDVIVETTDASGGIDEVFVYTGSFKLDDTVGVDKLIVGAGVATGVKLTGNNLANTLVGGAGGDTLDGAGDINGAGESLQGGQGDDLYYIRSHNDMAVEAADEGTDQVILSVRNYDLAKLANIEVIRYDIDGTAGSDVLLGGWAADTLDGSAGNDTLDGGAGMDWLIGGKGDDVFYMTPGDAIIEEGGGGYDTIVASFSASLGNDTQVEVLQAAAGVAPLTVGGANMNDTLIGNEGANTLSGGSGMDTMRGGGGDDTYIVDNAGDFVSDASGLDTVQTSVSYSLANAAGIENLTAAGAGSLLLSGNSLNNVITGNAGPSILKGENGNDIVTGGASADRLYGGYGNDVLNGGTGKDIFVFNAKLGTSKTDRKVNFDTITGFSTKDDGIWLENKIFKKVGKKGSEKKPIKLNKKFFKIGEKAKDKDDYIVYSKKKGVLYYDADGSGSKKAIEIAKLDKKLKLTYKDFFVI